MNIKIDAKRTFIFLVSCNLILIGAHLLSVLFRFGFGHWSESIFTILNLDEEANIPAFYSAVILLFSSILLFIIAFFCRAEQKKDYKYWLGLALVFLFLSFDESASIHELIIRVFWRLYKPTEFDNYVWLVPYGILVIILTVVYWRFIFALPRKIYILFLISGALYVGGALGFESVGAFYIGASWYQAIEWDKYADAGYYLISTVEESGEMFGVVIFIYALMSYIELTWQGLYVCGDRPPVEK